MERNILSCLVMFLLFLLLGYASTDKCSLKQMKADVAFILDSSSSLNDVDFSQMLKFMDDFVDSVTIGPKNVRLAVAIYAFYVKPKISFDSYLNEVALKNAVKNIARYYGKTNTHLGLQWVLQQFTNRSMNARKSTRHLGILITDGYSSEPEDTKKEAKLLPKANVEMIAIGVTNATKKDELSAIASSNNNVFVVNNFTQLLSIQNSFQKRICDGLQITKQSTQSRTASTPLKSTSGYAHVQVTYSGAVTLRQKTTATHGLATTTVQKVKQITMSVRAPTQTASISTLISKSPKTKPKQMTATSKQTKVLHLTTKSKMIPLITNSPVHHTTNPVKSWQDRADSSEISSYPKLWQIVVIAAASLAIIGAMFCICYFCCRSACQHEQDEVLMVDKTGSKNHNSSNKLSENFGTSRVSPVVIPVVSKSKPMPMSDGNAFVF